MRKMTLFKVLFVMLACVIALGFYRGWFVLSGQGRSDGDNKVDVNLMVDPDKAKQDANAVESNARERIGNSPNKKDASPSEKRSESQSN